MFHRALRFFVLTLAVAPLSARADVFHMSAGSTSLQFVNVGDAGNVADPATGSVYGAVGYNYQMGKYDVTLGQYAAFLNAVAASDPYGLYNSNMGTDFGTQGISQTGSAGSYSYSVTGSAPGAANMPVFDVTWGDAARFCNWLQNGQPNLPEGPSTTELGSYTLSGETSQTALAGVARTPGASYFIPTENEWYKAAYYVGGGTNAGYTTYPTQNNSMPTNLLASAGTSTNAANFFGSDYSDSSNLLTPAGTFTDSPGAYGTYDMGGDVYQWNETSADDSYRGLRRPRMTITGTPCCHRTTR